MKNIEKLFTAKVAAKLSDNAGTAGARQAQQQSANLGTGMAGAGAGAAMQGMGTGLGTAGAGAAAAAAPKDVMSTTPQAQHGIVGGGGSSYADTLGSGGALGGLSPEQRAQALQAIGQGTGGVAGMGNGLYQNSQQSGFGDVSARNDVQDMPVGLHNISGAGSMFQGFSPTEAQRAGASHQPSMYAGMARMGAGALNTINPYMKNMGKALRGTHMMAGRALQGMMNGPTEAQRAGVTHSNEIDRRTNSVEHQNAIQAQNTPFSKEHDALRDKIRNSQGNDASMMERMRQMMPPNMFRR